MSMCIYIYIKYLKWRIYYVALLFHEGRPNPCCLLLPTVAFCTLCHGLFT